MKVRIDRGGITYLPVCACGWRGLPSLDHGSALHEARHHELRAHTGQIDVAKALERYRARHADTRERV